MTIVRMVDEQEIRLKESYKDVVSTLAMNSPFMEATLSQNGEAILIAKLHVVSIKP